jgi:excisionase family DNA binding protein
MATAPVMDALDVGKAEAVRYFLTTHQLRAASRHEEHLTHSIRVCEDTNEHLQDVDKSHGWAIRRSASTRMFRVSPVNAASAGEPTAPQDAEKSLSIGAELEQHVSILLDGNSTIRCRADLKGNLMESDPLAYDIPTAAAMVGIGRTRMYEEIDAGRVLSVKIGTRRLVSRRALEQYIATLEQEATALVAR